VISEDGGPIGATLIDRCGQDVEFVTEEQMRQAVGHVRLRPTATGCAVPKPVQTAIQKAWGPPPGNVMRCGERHSLSPGCNTATSHRVQPARGYGDNPVQFTIAQTWLHAPVCGVLPLVAEISRPTPSCMSQAW